MFKLPVLNESQLKKDVLNTLQKWGKSTEVQESELRKFTLVRARRRELLSDKPFAERLAINDIVLAGLEALKEENEQAAEILQERFLNKQKVQAVTNKLKFYNQDQTKRAQRNAIDQLVEILLKQEYKFRQAYTHLIESQIPPATYTQNGLFGIEGSLQTLKERLLNNDGSWVVVISGIGGIGKTSLADATLRHIIQYFCYDTIIWIRLDERINTAGESQPDTLVADFVMHKLATQLCSKNTVNAGTEQRNAAVRQILKTHPCLVVIDNLELELNATNLCNFVNGLANPSKFLVTSRTRPKKDEVGIYDHPLTDLSLTDATKLIAHHAQEIGLTDLAHVTEKEVAPIYEIIGGNPLALKLVVSLATIIPLAQIVAELIHARIEKVEKMYRQIYQVVWASLSQDAKALLEIMPMASANGMGVEQMRVLSDLPQSRLWEVIIELVQRSLLEIRDNGYERRYGIHQLTNAFLQTDVIGLLGDHV